jgi:hypothetical protein
MIDKLQTYRWSSCLDYIGNRITRHGSKEILFLAISSKNQALLREISMIILMSNWVKKMRS